MTSKINVNIPSADEPILLSGNLLTQISPNDPLVTKLLGTAKSKTRKLSTLYESNVLVLKLITEDCLIILAKKKSRLGEVGLECITFINASPFTYFQLLWDMQKVAALRWPNKKVFIYINPVSKKYARLFQGIEEAGWISTAYRTSRRAMFEKELKIE